MVLLIRNGITFKYQKADLTTSLFVTFYLKVEFKDEINTHLEFLDEKDWTLSQTKLKIMIFVLRHHHEDKQSVFFKCGKIISAVVAFALRGAAKMQPDPIVSQ